MTTITAAVTEAAGGGFTLQELELGELRADEVLVEIRAVGICHTDLMGRDGVLPTPFPAVFGHEGAGIVERVGAGDARPGRRTGEELVDPGGRPVVDDDPVAVVGHVEDEVLAHDGQADQADVAGGDAHGESFRETGVRKGPKRRKG